MTVAAYLDIKIDIGGCLCIDRKELSLALIPTLRIRASASISLDLGIMQIGMGIEADILTIALVPTIVFGLDTGGGFRASIEGRLVLAPFGMRFYVMLTTFFLQLLPKFGLCLEWYGPIPIPTFCDEARLILFEFIVDPIDIFLGKAQSGPYDVTPPKEGVITGA